VKRKTGTKAASKPTSARAAKKPKKAATTPATRTKATRAATATATPKKAVRTSVLDAAAQVLSASDGPMTCQGIVDVILEAKMWSTTGKTPAASLNAALHRDIAKRGKESRFRKAERGRFELAK
jgi:hypothetical protein